MSDSTKGNKAQIVIKHLPIGTTLAQVLDVTSKYGPVKSIRYTQPKELDHRNFYLLFEDKRDVEDLMKELNEHKSEPLGVDSMEIEILPFTRRFYKKHKERPRSRSNSPRRSHSSHGHRHSNNRRSKSPPKKHHHKKERSPSRSRSNSRTPSPTPVRKSHSRKGSRASSPSRKVPVKKVLTKKQAKESIDE